MKYLCLIYAEEANASKVSQSEMRQVMADYDVFTKDIVQKGQYVAGEALQFTNTATTVRVREGKVLTTDGPFAETKEQLGGFYMIDATDLNEALQIASRIPGARWGSVEVRPVMVFPKPT